MGGHGHGHGDHGHAHKDPYVIPDYRTFKVEDAPDLVRLQKGLAAQGLTDPWLRNEVWRYNKKVYPHTPAELLRQTIFRGFKYGFVAFVLTMVGTELYDRHFPDEHAHGHGDHH